VSLPGVSASSDAFSSNTFSDSPQGFTATGSGILLPGSFGFFAQLFGQANASANGFFGASSGAASNFGSLGFSITLTPIPEPGTMTLLGLSTLGLAGFGWMRRRKQVVTA
jgi:hypothetical protein